LDVLYDIKPPLEEKMKKLKLQPNIYV